MNTRSIKHHALMMSLAMLRVPFLILAGAVSLGIGYLLLSEVMPWLKDGTWGPQTKWSELVGTPHSNWVKIQDVIDFIWALPAWAVLILPAWALWGLVLLLDTAGDKIEGDKRIRDRGPV